MAFEKPLVIQSFTAASDMTSASQQYCFVKLTGTAETVVPCAATADLAIGVLQNLPKQGQQAEVAVLGITKVRVGGTDITNVSGTSGLLSIDTAGRAIAAPFAAASSGLWIVGRALTASAVADGSGDNDGALLTAFINLINPVRSL